MAEDQKFHLFLLYATGRTGMKDDDQEGQVPSFSCVVCLTGRGLHIILDE